MHDVARRSVLQALLCASVAACSPKAEHDTAAPIRFWHPEFGGTDQAALTALIAEANRQHPDTPVEDQFVPGDYVSFRQQLQLAFMGGDPPPIFTSGVGYALKTLADQGRVAPLDDIWAHVQGDEVFPSGLRRSVVVNGSPYAIPLTSSFITNVFYNKPLFEKLALGIPTSWEEFAATCEVLKSNGYGALAHSGGPTFSFGNFLSPFFSVFGAEGYYAFSRGEVSYQSDEVRAAFELYRKYYVRHYMRSWSGFSWTGAADEFVKGAAGMCVAGGWAASYMNAKGFRPGVDYDVFASPAFQRTGGGVLQTDSIVMCGSVPAHAARSARNFLLAAAGPRAQAAYNSHKQAIPGNIATPVDGANPVTRRVVSQVTSDPKHPVLQNLLFMLPTGHGADFATETERFANVPTNDGLAASLEKLEAARLALRESNAFVAW